MNRLNKLHLHLETNSKRPALFHLTEEKWAAAAKRHRAAAAKLHVTIGWDGKILDDALKTADFMINSAPPKERLRERAPKLKWIQTTSAGVDALVPFDWLPKDIAFTNNTGAHGAKAEDSVTMAIAMLNGRIPEVLANQRARVWKPIFTTPVAGKTVVVLGFGDLGQGAGRGAKHLGAHVIAVTRSGKAARPADRAVTTARLDAVLPKADFLVVTTPLTPQTRGLISRQRLDRLKPTCGVINIGRSPIIDYEALRAKLDRGELAGAVLDVFDVEPLPADSPWWTTRNAIVLPHISCDDPRYIDHLFDFWFANFARWLAKKPLQNQVDRRLGY